MFGAVIGALLGTQTGRDVEIVNTFELAMEDDNVTVDQGFLVTRKELCQLSETQTYVESLVAQSIHR